MADVDTLMEKFLTEIKNMKVEDYKALDAVADKDKLDEIQKEFEAWREKEKDKDKDKEPAPESAPEQAPESTPNPDKEPEKDMVPTDEFKQYLETEKLTESYNNADAKPEDKAKIESDYKEKTGHDALREAKQTKFGQDFSQEGNDTGDQAWKKMRREAWKKYATDHQQAFVEDDKKAGLAMTVGETPIHYQDENHVSMGNGEYEKFLQAVSIEKAASTDIINFGDIKSEDYKAKLAAACLQLGMQMKNGPKSIDLSLDCFKNIDAATKAKIEAYNEASAGKKDEPNKKDEPKKEGDKDYQKIYADKVKELAEAKAKGSDKIDLSQIKDPVEKMIAFAATKEAGVGITGLANVEDFKITDNKANKEMETAFAALPETAQKAVTFHNHKVEKVHEIKEKVKNKELKRGQFRDKDGNIQQSQLSNTNKDADGKPILDDKGNATRSPRVDRNTVQYEIDPATKKKSYVIDKATNLYQQRKKQGRG